MLESKEGREWLLQQILTSEVIISKQENSLPEHLTQNNRYCMLLAGETTHDRNMRLLMLS